MIPLSFEHKLKRFPYACSGLILLWLIFYIAQFFLAEQNKEYFIFNLKDLKQTTNLLALLVPSSFFILLINSLYAWTFISQEIDRSGFLASTVQSLVSSLFAIHLYSMVYPEVTQLYALSHITVAAYLGAFMLKNIWGNCSTLVFGFLWIRIFSVPSYVLLFFWFFYLLLNQVFISSESFSMPMTYLPPFLAFLIGFGIEAVKYNIYRYLDK